jgi:hypothetical protein
MGLTQYVRAMESEMFGLLLLLLLHPHALSLAFCVMDIQYEMKCVDNIPWIYATL